MSVTYSTRGYRQKIVVVLLVFGWVLGLAAPAMGQAAGSGVETLTLDDAIRMAQDMNPSVLDALDALEIARSNLALVQEGTFDPAVTVTGQVGLVGNLESGVEISIQDTIPIPGIGKKPIALERAEIALAQAEQAVNLARQDAVYQVINAYFTVLRSERMAEVARLAEQIALVTVQDTQVRFGQGNASQSDLWRSEQNYLEAQASSVQAVSGLSIHLRRLGLVIGANLNGNILLQKPVHVQRNSLDRTIYVEYALKYHPGLLDLAFEQERAEIALEEVLESRRPQIGLVGSLREDQWSLSVKTQNPAWDLDWEIRGRLNGEEALNISSNSFTPTNNGWGAGIEVSWIPFDGGVGRERERQERIKLEQIERTIRLREEQVELEIDEAIQTVLDAENRLVMSELGLQIEEENFLVRTKQLEKGFITDREYLHSEYQLSLATMNHDAAVFDFILSRVRLDQAAGQTIQLATILAP